MTKRISKVTTESPSKLNLKLTKEYVVKTNLENLPVNTPKKADLSDYKMKIESPSCPLDSKSSKVDKNSSLDSSSYEEANVTQSNDGESLNLSTHLFNELANVGYDRMENINKFNDLRIPGIALKKTPSSKPCRIVRALNTNSKGEKVTIDDFIQLTPIHKFVDFPMYFGYYFREMYRNTISKLPQ